MLKKAKQYKLQDLYKQAANKKESIKDKEEKELQLAIELSKKEHILEQQRLFELLQREQQQRSSTSFADIEEDDWFQTVSHRRQPNNVKRQKIALKEKPATSKKPKIKKTTSIKQEKDEPLVIDNLSSFLIKKDPEEQENIVIENLSTFLKKEEEEQQQIVIENLTAFLDCEQEESTFTNHNNNRQIEKNIKCSICENWFADELAAQSHLPECNNIATEDFDEQMTDEPIREIVEEQGFSESDCSVIDLCNPNAEEDDGYLSPLEGFTNVLDIQGDNPFLAQFERNNRHTATSTTTSTGARSTTTRKRSTTTRRSNNSSSSSKRPRRIWRRKRRQKK